MLPFGVIIMLFAAASSASIPTPFGREEGATAPSGVSASPSPVYDAGARAVGNWQVEADRSLDPQLLVAAALLLRVERPVVARCVKLNNYWCIKQARWPGEIGGDGEGHTAFADGGASADAAVALLRRYYLIYDRRSALDIVRRWAPADCRSDGSFSTFGAVLAVKGLARTVRARFLASRRGLQRVGRVRGRSVASTRPATPSLARAPMPRFRVPDIAVGLGERSPESRAASARGNLRSLAPTPGLKASAASKRGAGIMQANAPVRVRAGGFCADEQRIESYAERIAMAAGVAPGADLQLFERSGAPSRNLARVMLAMSSVELGLLRANAALVEAAIMRARTAPSTDIVPSVSTPPADGRETLP